MKPILPSVVLQSIGVVWQLVGPLTSVVEQLTSIDGDLSGEDARDIGYEVSDTLGDMQIRVRGRDILHRPAQREILGGLARIANQLVRVNRL